VSLAPPATAGLAARQTPLQADPSDPQDAIACGSIVLPETGGEGGQAGAVPTSPGLAFTGAVIGGAVLGGLAFLILGLLLGVESRRLGRKNAL
jgi:hypothetical protein